MDVTVTPDLESGGARVSLSGDITEGTSFAEVLGTGALVLLLDLSRVRRITSSGVREWLGFVAQVRSSGQRLVFERCSVSVVQQLNMVVGFLADADVRSVHAPYYCGACDAEQLELVELDGGPPALSTVLACRTCGAAAEFDDLPDSYLSFLR